ncbi:MAG: efflux RND transporter periplasmic adaptor subunit [Anaerolineales bacterium]
MDRGAIRKYIPLFLFIGSLIIAVIYLINVSGSGSGGLEASGTVEAVSVLVGPEALGRVMEVYVEEGGYVEQGDPLFSLDDELLRVQRGRIVAAGEAAVTAAELQLLMVQQALDDLYEDWPLVAAHAELELARSKDAFEDVIYIHDVRQEGNRASKNTIDAAEANLILAENEVDRAKEVYDALSGRSVDDPARALALSNLVAARNKRDSVLRNLNWYMGTPTEIEQMLLDADVSVAEARVSDAELELDKWKDGPDPAALALLEAQLANAQAQLKLAYSQTEVELQTIDLQLKDLVVLAPINGVVLTRRVEPGEVLLPGAAALMIGDLDHLTITVYVPEDRYGEIALGSQVLVSVDSFPDLAFHAYVLRIADQAEFTPRNVQTEEGRKTTVFAVELSVDDPMGRLKPGMPADVLFDG